MLTIAADKKNCHVIAYLLWKVLTGLHKEIHNIFNSGTYQIHPWYFLWPCQKKVEANKSWLLSRYCKLQHWFPLLSITHYWLDLKMESTLSQCTIGRATWIIAQKIKGIEKLNISDLITCILGRFLSKLNVDNRRDGITFWRMITTSMHHLSLLLLTPQDYL